jgi:type I restriction enzyme R subunit
MGFAAQVATFDRESCVRYKEALDEYLPPEASDVVMTVNSGEEQYAAYRRDRDAAENLLDRFRDQADSLKVLIVTSKLLTGFDAPILQAMYLDKPLRDHTLLQAICRTNRPYGELKTHGLIVDYLGVFDDVAKAIQFDEQGVTRVVTNIAELVSKLPAAIQTCLGYFPEVDRTVGGYEGLIAAQECLPNNDTRDRFAADVSYLSRLWEAISPDPILSAYETDYRWLAQVYESLKPSTGTGKLLWHVLGPKTIELIHEHVHVDAIRDDLETLVLDAGPGCSHCAPRACYPRRVSKPPAIRTPGGASPRRHEREEFAATAASVVPPGGVYIRHERFEFARRAALGFGRIRPKRPRDP